MADLERRAFIRKAAVAGTVAWIAPTIVAVRADASTLGSTPYPHPPDVEPPVALPAPAHTLTHDEPSGALAYTGSEAVRDATVGVTLGAIGAAMLGYGQPDWDVE